jgi:hypothetical protein
VSIAFATVAALLALSAAGFVPVVATVGFRWSAIPLTPLAGAVLAAVAATASLSFGGPLLTWFVGLAVVAALAVFVVWVQRPELGPWGRPTGRRQAGRIRYRVVGIVGFLAVVVSCAICLRGLRTPTVGFDARALWLMRPGWFLQSHAQLLVDMRARDLVLTQSAYPPLVSASAAVAWRLTGLHTARLGVTTIAVLNICALAAAALAVIDAGRTAAARMAGGGLLDRADTSPERLVEAGAKRAAPVVRPPWAPMLTGVIAAVLLVFVASGVTEPFLTNGYADPLWSLAAVGAVAFGLQSRTDRSTRAAAVVLILVAGLTKDEGFVTAVALVVLVAARSVGWPGIRGDRRRWTVPVALAVVELAVLAWWPLLMRGIGARGASSTFTTSNSTASRADAVVHGMSPYLHVLVLALPLSIVGGLALTAVRRRSGLGNDLWAWLALAVGLVAVGGALLTGGGAILPWIRSTVHRITEYPILEGWWIIAAWAVAASSGVVRSTTSSSTERSDDAEQSHDRHESPDHDRVDSPVGVLS